MNFIAKKQITQQRSNNGKILQANQLSSNAWHIILPGIMLIAGLWMFVWYQINSDYDRSIDEASRETMNLAIAFEEHVTKIINHADNDLINLKHAYKAGGISSSIFVDSAIHAAKGSTRSLVAVFNEQGTVIASFIQDATGAERVDREYFNFHLYYDRQKLFIGKPIIGKISGTNTIPLSRRINKPDGSFGGIVYIGLRLDYLLGFYRKMNLDQDQLIGVIGEDGFVMAHQSGDKYTVGHDLTGSPLWKKLQISPSGTYISNEFPDGVKRVISYRATPDYPLVFTVGKSSKVALAGYTQRKYNYILGASLVNLLIVIVSILLVSRAEKQKAAKIELERLVEERTLELLQEKDRLATLINSMSDEVWFSDTKKQITLINRAGKKDLNFLSIDVVNNPTCEVLNPNGSHVPLEQYPVLRALQGQVIRDEIGILRNLATGEIRYKEVSASPVKDTDGNIIGAISVIHDITERKAMADELAKARDNHFKRCLDNLDVLVIIFRAKRNKQGLIVDFTFEYFNEAARKHFNLCNERDIGRGLLEVAPYVRLFDNYCNVVESGDPWVSESFTYSNTELSHQNGIYDIRVTKFEDGVALCAHNITEKTNYEKELARLDRLNLIGEMAASIGHEIRNPLTATRGFLQYFQRKSEFTNYYPQIETMIEELDRANGIISEFLSLAKNKSVALTPNNLNKIISTLLPLIQAEALCTGHEVQIQLGNIPDIFLDEKEIRQLILNLLRNGLEAMPSGGILTIRTYVTDEQLCLSVQDCGTGIPKEILAKLGTPFVTTKEKGTGLGLPVCYRIVERHGGIINVDTSENGTIFTINFPLNPGCINEISLFDETK